MGVARLALPLLLLTGRRTTEILNGASRFAPARPTTALFAGALKKRGASHAFEIPLLCDCATLAHALGALRAAQGHEQLGARECNNKYQKLLNAAVGDYFPMVRSVHELRAMYAAYAFHLYRCDATFNRCAMRILGHEKLEVSLSYNHVVLHDLQGAGSYGPLP